MSKNSNLYPLVPLIVAIAVVVLLGQPAYAHEEHKKKPPPTPAAESSASHLSHAHEHPDIAIAEDRENLPREPTTFLSWIGRFHPMVVHFPIALLITALAAEIFFAATNRELFRHALRFILWGGVLTAITAAPLGWIFAATGPTEHGWLLEAHRWVGTSAATLGLVVFGINERTERVRGSRTLLRLSLLVASLLIGATGFLGGSLLYGIDYLAWYPQ